MITSIKCHNLSFLNQWSMSFLLRIHNFPINGHPGKERSFRQAQSSYFWPTMRTDILRHCLLCHSCAQHRPSVHFESITLAYLISHAPWDSLSVDILKLPITENGFRYLLMFIDSFSLFFILVPLKNKSTQLAAQFLTDEVIFRDASPRVQLSEFNNEILSAVCEAFQIKICNIVT